MTNPITTLRPSSPGSSGTPLYTLRPVAASEPVQRDAGPDEYLQVSSFVVPMLALQDGDAVRAYLNLTSFVLTSADVISALGYAPVQTVAGQTGNVLLGVTDVAGAAPSNDAHLTGVPTAPTAAPGTSTTQIATTAFVATTFLTTAAALLVFAPIVSPAFTGVPIAPTAAVDVSTTQIATTAFVVNQIQATAPRRNMLIGGNFDTNPFQETTAIVSVATLRYVADMWQWFQAGTTGVVNSAKSANAPTVVQAGFLVTNCLAISVTTADATVGVGDYGLLSTYIEGYDWAYLAQRPFTLSFWHAHTKVGTHCVGFRNSVADRGYVAEYAQTNSNAWEYASITVPASPSAGTWNYTTGIGLQINFPMHAGSSLQAAAGAWAALAAVATANLVNSLDNVANVFRLALVQIEAGSYATPFERRPKGEEDMLCRRYYETSYPAGTAVPTNTTIGFVSATSSANVAASGVVWHVTFGVPKRIAPTTVSIYSYTSSTLSKVSDGGGTDLAVNSGVAISKTTQGFDVQNQSGGAIAPASNCFAFHWAADARF